MNKPRILVIDDEPRMLDILSQALSDLGFKVETADDGPKGITRYSENPTELVLLDIWMTEMDGIEVLGRLKDRNPNVMVIVMTGYGSIESAVQAMKAGAVDYLTKPLDLDHLEIVLKKALESREQSEKLRILEDQVSHQGSFEGLVGVSQEMQIIYGLIRKLGDSDATVLVQGETGTGKELVARAIHKRSPRRKSGFMPINCGALTDTILESELFGHEKGAFTGAIRQKQGLIEQAEAGTLFLDEIEEMSPLLQVKLLRAIQEKEILRVGGDRPRKVDFRLIATTNLDLRDQMEKGAFRPDLFYRLSVITLDLPPLRARTGDIPLLVNHFLTGYSQRTGNPVKEMTAEALMMLKAYRWPGNVRELENVFEQTQLLCQGNTVAISDLPKHITSSVSDGAGTERYDMPLREAREQFERHYLKDVLDRAGGQVAEAARRAGIHRRHFYEKMKLYGISRK